MWTIEVMLVTIMIIRFYSIFFDPEQEHQVDYYLHGLMFIMIVGSNVLLYYLFNLIYLVTYAEFKTTLRMNQDTHK